MKSFNKYHPTLDLRLLLCIICTYLNINHHISSCIPQLTSQILLALPKLLVFFEFFHRSPSYTIVPYNPSSRHCSVWVLSTSCGSTYRWESYSSLVHVASLLAVVTCAPIGAILVFPSVGRVGPQRFFRFLNTGFCRTVSPPDSIFGS